MVVMTSQNPTAHWRTFRESGADEAFHHVVAGYFDLVYSAALRVVAGDTHLAQDVAQTVFTDLARQAPRLPAEFSLGGWLYRHTSFTAAKAVRTEQRRRARERKAMENPPSNEAADQAWQRIAPVLEEAMGRLRPVERDALVLRYFEGQPLRAVGAALDTSEEGARKRVDRALDRLRADFARRGLPVATAVLTHALNTQAVTTAPAGMAATVGAAALATAVTAGGAGGGLTLISKLIMLTKTQLTAGALLAVLTSAVLLEYRRSAALQAEQAALAAQLGTPPPPATAAPGGKAAATPPILTTAEQRELLRLRSEVGALRREIPAATNTVARERAARQKAATDPVAAAVLARETAIAKMNYSRQWGLAFILAADGLNGRVPTNFDEALPFLPPHDGPTNLTPAMFEIMYSGKLPTDRNPSQTILLRERTAERDPVTGAWLRTYGFVDGHSEVHRAPDGNFSAWESTRLAPVDSPTNP